jgi:hypothetical protein
MKKITIECDVGEVSDGYHSFNELYAHRCTLFAALMLCNPSIAWRSRFHSDRTFFDGWFIGGMYVPTDDSMVTYHLPNHMWDLLGPITEYSTAPQWDGHTSKDVIKRLHEWLKILGNTPKKESE